jgi:hypothetical protein
MYFNVTEVMIMATVRNAFVMDGQTGFDPYSISQAFDILT